MSKLGDFIKEKREAAGLTYKDISKVTAIREHYLEVLERGEFETLPSYVHVHGFLEQYSKVLGLDFRNEVKPLLDEECAKESFGKTADEIAVESKSAKKSFSLPIVQILGGIVLIVVVALVAYLLRSGGFSSKGSASRAAVNPPRVETIATVEEPAPVSTPVDEPEPQPAQIQESAPVNTPIVTPQVQSAPGLPIQERQNAVLQFSEDCWVYFMADGDNTTIQDFIAVSGGEQRVYFNKYFMLHVGNAAALTVTHGTENLASIGNQGQPMRNLYFTVNENGHMVMSRTAPIQ